MFSHMLAQGLFERRPAEGLLWVIATVAYGEYLVGAFWPQGSQVSIAAHIAGLAGGIVAAWILRPTAKWGARLGRPQEQG